MSYTILGNWVYDFILSSELKPHPGDRNGKVKGVGSDTADREEERNQAVRHY